MKKIIFLVILIITITATGFADDRIFPKYPGGMKISTVYVSPAALKLGLSLTSKDSKINSLKSLMKKPESIEILNTRRDSSFSVLNRECKKKVKELKMELILNCSQKGEKVNIYIGKIINSNEIKDIMIETEDADEYSIVYIKGIINAKELLNRYK